MRQGSVQRSKSLRGSCITGQAGMHVFIVRKLNCLVQFICKIGARANASNLDCKLGHEREIPCSVLEMDVNADPIAGIHWQSGMPLPIGWKPVFFQEGGELRANDFMSGTAEVAVNPFMEKRVVWRIGGLKRQS